MSGAHVRSLLVVLLTSVLPWPQPGAVLPLPSRSGAEGPPRPFGRQPPPGRPAPDTSPAFKRAQDRALLYGPFPADGLQRGISDGTLTLSSNPAVREQALALAGRAGVSVVRLQVDWRSIVAEAPAAGSDLADPACGCYDFSTLDAAVRSVVERGLTPLLIVSHAPVFAEGPGRWPYAYPGSWDPSPEALRTFATALATRYDGSFPDPQSPGDALPRVRFFQAWNEPNLPHYLEPQWVVRSGRWSAFSPVIYRAMLDGFYAGIKAAVPSDVVASAGLAPNGDPEGVGRMAPVPFLRELLCLPAGRVACPQKASFDVFAFHPLSVGNPDLAAPSSADVSICDAAKLTALLAQAERAHTVLPAGAKPVWVTELNWESDPPATRYGVPARLQAQWVSRALHRLWIAGVTLVDWQFLVDPYPSLQLAGPRGEVIDLSRPEGLYSPGPGGSLAGARPKRFLQGFALPFDPLRIDRTRVRVWALLGAPAEPALLQQLSRTGTWRTIAQLRADSQGILNGVIKLSGRVILRLRAGALTSAEQTLPARFQASV